ncbi:electron transfer flavoprotein subunit alpha/FixB family protein [Reyranella sp.]|jgi:electron transfer flavoprotein alpha subunit|uniref:electron transfer flavoprotein subunit alpha/FixB family protein n=1 Tax=Reyranella sp. TaxID=1929291 RepID=UPI002F942789
MAILVVAAHDGKTVRANVANAVAAAGQMGSDVTVLVAGSNCGEAAKSAAALQGVAKVLQAEDAAYANWVAEDIAPLVVKLAPNYSHIVMAADSVGKNLAPRVAALLDVAQVSEAIQVVSPDTFVRPIYAGNAMATVQTADKIKVVTIRPTNFKAVAGGGSAPVEQVGGEGAKGLSSYVGAELSKSERPELTSAKIVVSGGRGLASGENFKMLETLADKLGAGLGASRAAVDAGYVPNDYQVGQTGKVVAPDLYIAIGISGAIQHLAGMKDSKTIVAINKDEEAPIFQVADYGIVGDLFQIVPELTAAVEKK